MQSLHTQMPPWILLVPLQSACSFAPQQPRIFSHGSTIIFLSPKPQISNLPPGPNTQHTLISRRQVFSFPVFESLQLAWSSSSLASGLLMLLNASPLSYYRGHQTMLSACILSLSHTHNADNLLFEECKVWPCWILLRSFPVSHFGHKIKSKLHTTAYKPCRILLVLIFGFPRFLNTFSTDKDLKLNSQSNSCTPFPGVSSTSLDLLHLASEITCFGMISLSSEYS